MLARAPAASNAINSKSSVLTDFFNIIIARSAHSSPGSSLLKLPAQARIVAGAGEQSVKILNIYGKFVQSDDANPARIAPRRPQVLISKTGSLGDSASIVIPS